VADKVFLVNGNFFVTEITSIGNRLSSNVGTVYIAENVNGKILFCDGIGNTMWVYNYSGTPSFASINAGFTASYISFQDGYFIAAVKDQPQWRLALDGQLTTWPNIGAFQSVPDVVKACIPLPGRGGQLFIVGDSHIDSWVDIGASLFPYQKNTGYSIDYGCVSADTISRSENMVAWLGGNKDSGPVIMYTTGGEAIPISTDGINFQFSNLKYPEESYGFLFKQDGHLLYNLTFTNAEDNYSLVYDFNTKKFFNVTDQYGNYYIARDVAMFNNKYCCISFNDANVYIMDSEYTTYDGAEIPRVRIANNIRFIDASGFVVNSLTFTVEQGENKEPARIDLSISRDGGVSFGNKTGIELNPFAERKNKLIFWNLGYANDFVPKFEFWGFNRFVMTDGIVSVFK
jgi:hypothetical protein